MLKVLKVITEDELHRLAWYLYMPETFVAAGLEFHRIVFISGENQQMWCAYHRPTFWADVGEFSREDQGFICYCPGPPHTVPDDAKVNDIIESVKMNILNNYQHERNSVQETQWARQKEQMRQLLK